MTDTKDCSFETSAVPSRPVLDRMNTLSAELSSAATVKAAASSSAAPAPSSSSTTPAAPAAPVAPEAPKTPSDLKRDAGNVAFREKRFAEAIALYGEAIELDPSNPNNYNNRGMANKAAGAFVCAHVVAHRVDRGDVRMSREKRH